MRLGLLLLATAAQAASPAREELAFDFGWRFSRIGDDGRHVGCSGKYAFTPKDGFQCDGLQRVGGGDRSPTACQTACCDDDTCSVWQWSNASQNGGCWAGGCIGSLEPNPAWQGAVRLAPEGPVMPSDKSPQVQPGFDDSSWQLINTPHDSLIDNAPSLEHCSTGCSGRSYIPRYSAWYRKRFTAPSDWQGRAVWLYFEGVFNLAEIFLNGRNISAHGSGYTSFTVRLDGAGLQFGGRENTLAVFVDPDKNRNGWWYEGGGIYRHVRIVATSHVHLKPDSVFTHADLGSLDSSAGALVSQGAVLHASAVVANTGSSAAAHGLRAQFTLIDPNGLTVGATTVPIETSIPAAGQFEVSGDIRPAGSVKLWQIQSPALYTVSVSVEAADGQLDQLNVTTGFRSLRYEANTGFYLNDQPTKIRGFCDHNDFASLGMAVPDRIKLFRAQASRSVGGNGRRTSHNPPDPVMLDIYDRVGIAVMDENRNLGNSSTYEQDMRDLVARDRNHPSVTIWSFCNEAGCEGDAELGGPRFQKATYELDGSRPTLANMFSFNDLLSKTIDVQGFSHRPRQTVDQCHAAMPNKPIFMSECCSCNTMRGEDRNSGQGLQQAFNADCQQSQTNASDGVPYAIGTMVWTLFDYYGEPSNNGWPYVSSTFGSFDLAGFPKAAAFWFRSQWLYGISDTNSDKTFKTEALGEQAHMVHIVESWESYHGSLSSTNQTFGAQCETGNVRQQMRFTGAPDGSPGSIINHDGLCVNASCSDHSNGCYPLDFIPCAANPGSIMFRALPGAGLASVPASGLCLDLFGGAGPKVGLWRCVNNSDQRWVVEHESIQLDSTTCLSDTPETEGTSRTVHAYSDAPSVELQVNGVSLGAKPVRKGTLGGSSWAEWDSVEYAPGNLTAHALMGGKSVAQHSVFTSGTPKSLRLSLDCPSPLTGTGSALLLDGLDTALVRATIVDGDGNQCQSASANVSFSVVSGPGRIVGAHNGDPKSHEPNQRPYHSAYHGLVRAAVQVTQDATSPLRARMMQVDVENQVLVPPGQAHGGAIVLKAVADGLASATLEIPVSTDAAKDSVLAVAATYGSTAVLGFDE